MTNDLRRLAFWMAVGFLGVAVCMTMTVGFRFAGLLFAVGLALVTIGAAILPSFAHHAWNEGNRFTAVFLGATAGVFAIAEYGSHVSYAVTHRSAEVETVGYASTAYDDSRAQVALLTRKETQLDEQSRWEARPVASVVADLEAAKVNKRWASTGECDPAQVTAKLSRDFCAKVASLIAEKANAEEALTARAELEVVRAELLAARTGSAGKTPGVSMASTTDTLVAQLAGLTLDPSKDARKAAGIGIGSWLALAFALGAGVFWFIAWMPTPSGPAAAAMSEHPDLPAALRVQAAALAAKSREMGASPMDPPDLARRRFLGAIAAPGGGITPMSRLESGINWRSAA